MSLIRDKRSEFHQKLLATIITVSSEGTLSIADRASVSSKAISAAAVELIGKPVVGKKIDGQRAGSIFEDICREFLEETFLAIGVLRPGIFTVKKGGAIYEFKQFKHLGYLSEMSAKDPDLATAIGQDYLIKPDIVIARSPEPDSRINAKSNLVDNAVSNLTPLRLENSSQEMLHATISCKFTIRSDRAQNARSEALNVIRNRKGHVPHISVITPEPMPSRLASLALGTGDIDCVYHAFLPELLLAVERVGSDDSLDMLRTMIEGERLRDIADLPFDLAV